MYFLAKGGRIHRAPTLFMYWSISWILETCIVLAPGQWHYFGELKEADLIFGKFDIEDDSTLINHILLSGKYYIYSRKCQNAKPSLKGLVAKMKRVYSI